ncbi:hypothetical protein SAMN02910447_02354 [Ruminococcus sp. YE71]|uniref:hypothetical protein n=1 Tax=unclassified Ruminococcus TaxID=2608920 RepID=UPI00088E2A96|nr:MULTISPECIES: hypothetical protein [unclassified Ruminococcus]SDA23683.1 hypothetical protein SAMN02910446_02221 [Ruminococcus sp. YE78]SFW40271.1 hypothetical protein SAMN02910447_02354 [Ruminococcus sp. YE71]
MEKIGHAIGLASIGIYAVAGTIALLVIIAAVMFAVMKKRGTKQVPKAVSAAVLVIAAALIGSFVVGIILY